MINNEGGVERTGRKEGKKAENLQTDEILCPLRLYKFPESREIFGFFLLAQLNYERTVKFSTFNTFAANDVYIRHWQSCHSCR